MRQVLNQALLKPLQEDVAGQIQADEHHLADARFVLAPLGAQVAAHQLVHALKAVSYTHLTLPTKRIV